jgi:transposase-like protein
MRKDTAGPESTSTAPTWETLEGMVRQKAQELIQHILEEEVTELLGRQKSERRAGVDAPNGYRNGYGKPRRLAMSSGTITVRRPRVRGLEERFESRVLPLFARRTKEVAELIPELYLHGLAEGDFELALRGLLGDGAPLSKASVRRLRESWTEEFEAWSSRSLEGREIVYMWADGIYVKAGLERDKAALLVVIGAHRDGTKEVLALRPGYRESVESWSEVFRNLKARGIGAPRLLLADGNAAIWGASRQVWPEAGEQRCWNHKMRNVLDRLPKREQVEAKDLLRKVAYAPTRDEAVKARQAFSKRYKPWYPKAGEVLEDDWDRMVTFFDFPEAHWKHLRTTNIVESPFASVRLRTSAAKRFKKVESATALIWKLLTVAEKRFRRLDAPHLLRDVHEGREFRDGKPVSPQQRMAAA